MKNIIKNIIKEIFRLERCHICSKNVGCLSNQDPRTVDGVFYCEECAKNNFKICECCNQIVDRLNSVDGKKVCNICFIEKTRQKKNVHLSV